MEHQNSDVPGDESPDCVYCGRQTGTDSDIVALRVGKITQGRKSGNWFFLPRPYPDGLDVRWFHQHCIQTMGFEITSTPDDWTDCMFCPEDLVGEATCFELEGGVFEIQGPDTVWIPRTVETPAGTERALAYACYECIEYGLGEGDVHAFRQRIGLPPLADQRRWINDRIKGDDDVGLQRRVPRKAPRRLRGAPRRVPGRLHSS